jgi:hypothetical protein
MTLFPRAVMSLMASNKVINGKHVEPDIGDEVLDRTDISMGRGGRRGSASFTESDSCGKCLKV